jgi:hypothetical protein
MILEGFEIENWSCIRKVAVQGLPPTGVIVFHGPNRTGKSSVVSALRACLMDFPSSSKSKQLTGFFPRGSGDRPIVSVSFRSGGTSFRVTKHFGSNKSELASKTAGGAWKVETTSSAEAHDRTCNHAGGSDSYKGLHQLLWLTQAEFQLPDAKSFDPEVQARLRGILGVLQTPLDDRFIQRVRSRWNRWFSGQRKPGKAPQMKEGCGLADYLRKHAACQKELQEGEAKFTEIEGLLRKAAELGSETRDLGRQLVERNQELAGLQEEHRRCQARILARHRAETDCADAEKGVTAATEAREDRADALRRMLEHEKAVEPAESLVRDIERLVTTKEQKQAERRRIHVAERDKRGALQERRNQIAKKLASLHAASVLTAAEERLARARELDKEIRDTQALGAANAAPSDADMERLKANRRELSNLQAVRDASAMELTLSAEKGTGSVHLALDGGQAQDVPISEVGTRYTVRRRAELSVPGWGRLEVSRAADKGDLEKIAQGLERCQEEFASAVARFGLAGGDPTALDALSERRAERRLRDSTLERLNEELHKLAPDGPQRLESKVIELRAKLADVGTDHPHGAESVSNDPAELHRLDSTLQEEIAALDSSIKRLEGEMQSENIALDQERARLTAAKEELAACKAKVRSSREHLGRLPSTEEIGRRVEEADRALRQARDRLAATELNDEERTIDDRLKAAEAAVRALEQQHRENAEKLGRIRGRLEESEGLHARRMSAAARAQELTTLIESESLDRDALDRLYELFEECREKQLGALVAPIQRRVLGWMRLLELGDYRELRFTDAFLPEKLMSRDGSTEFALEEESVGAQEQIGMLVRLALGSTLSSAKEPAVAILDDPLTHCDVRRLAVMRMILRRAAEGDLQLTPPAGPLQIIILTCHPEWFRDDGATVVDLSHAIGRFLV